MEMERSFGTPPPLASCCWISKKRPLNDPLASGASRITPEKRRRLSSDSPLSGCLRLAHLSGGHYLISILPEELLLHIFSYLQEEDLCQTSLVCKKFARVASDKKIWRDLFLRTFGVSRAYVHPKRNPELVKVDMAMLSWKQQFSVMHGAFHVKPAVDTSDQLNTFVTIEDAIFEAKDPYQIIIVHKPKSGPVNSSIVVDKPVVIIGAACRCTFTSDYITGEDAEGEVVLEEDWKFLVQFQPEAKDCAMVNLTLNGCCSAQGQATHTLDIGPDCCPIIEGCSVINTCFNGAAVYVHGEGANPRIKKCNIHHSNCVGVYVEDHAGGVIEDCNIHANKLAGVWIKSQASPRFLRNKVHHGKDCGFFVFDSGQGYMEANDIYSNRIAGVEIKSQANPVFYKNLIHHGKTGGVYIHEKGYGQFIQNRVYGNTYAGVWVTGESDPTLKENEICDGQQGGVYFFGGGRGLLEGNSIHGNALAGIQIRSESNPIIRNNQIHHGQHGGIYVHDNGRGLIESNEIHSNALAGIWITTGSEPVLRYNRIHSGKQVGIYFYDNGGGVVEECHIFNHAYSGIQIRSGSNPVIRNNAIYAGRNGGLLIYSGGLGVIEHNVIHSNALANVWIKTDSNPLLRRNKIYGGKEGGVCIFNRGRGQLEENEIFLSTLTGVLVNGSFPVLRRNKIFNGQSAGLEITNGGGGVYEDNEVFDNKAGGICVATGCAPSLVANAESDNGQMLEDALGSGQCLFGVSTSAGAHCYPMHRFYRCLTCRVSDADTVCESCIRKCHKGHNVEFIRFDKFYCDCGSGALKCDCALTGNRALTSPRVVPCPTCTNENGTSGGQAGELNSPTVQH